MSDSTRGRHSAQSRRSSARSSVSARSSRSRTSRSSEGSAFAGGSQARRQRELDGEPAGRHASGRAASSRRAAGANVDLSSGRGKKRAQRGYVSHLTPETQSRETDAQFSRRVSHGGFAEGVQRKSRVRRVISLLLLAVIVVGVGVGVGVGVYFGQSNSKLALSDSAASEMLVAPTEGEPYYALCVAEMGMALSETDGMGDAYLLVRIDEQNRALTFVGIPSHLSVRLSDGQVSVLHKVYDEGGDAALIAAVSEFAGVDIAHYAHTNAEGISQMVDVLGGVTVTLAEELDDPRAGTLYLQAGEQTLDSNGVITLLRASNFAGGYADQAANRIAVFMQLASAALSAEGLSFASELAKMADSVQASWSSSALMNLGEIFRPLDTVTVYTAVVPGYESGGSYVDSTAKWKTMMANIQAGHDPHAENPAIADVDRSGVLVEIRNGGGVTGAGAKMGEILTGFGYQVGEIGNTDDGTTYPETLVVYKDSAFAAAAEAIVKDAGAGRVVNGGDFYTFESNILVVVGKDWMPTS